MVVEAPSLVCLCLNTIADELITGDVDDEFTRALYELPSELMDSLLPRLTPLALELLQRCRPLYSTLGDNSSSQRKRKRWSNFEMAWKTLYEARWPSHSTESQPSNWLDGNGEVKEKFIDDWAQLYWESHLQSCVDAAAEKASLPWFSDPIGSTATPDALLEYIGNNRNLCNSVIKYSRFSDHCQHFGSYTRCLRLSACLCVPEICDLLRNAKLEKLEIQWIKSEQHVDGLCALLKQNCETLKSIEFIHCKLSEEYINHICDSMWIKDFKVHGVQHFSIKLSSFGETGCFPLPAGLSSFLVSGRSLVSLGLCDDRLQREFVKMVIDTLLDASSSIGVLDLSENYISGCLSHFKPPANSQQLSSRIGKSLQSLRVLNLRNNNLDGDDAESLRHLLVHMPKLETLDLSHNPIEDGIMSIIPYLAEVSERPYLRNLKLENCELTFDGVNQLLQTLSTWRKPLSSLSIRENHLGRKMGALLGKFLSKGIQYLDIEDIGLDPHGFQEAEEEITGKLKLVYINISKNRGGRETAIFLAKLISCAPELVAIDAKYNFMTPDSVSLLCSTLKTMEGTQ
ncbi:OLC1v1004720C1 [Oldenlandia corymbosa var. corymbosa]|uniref:OLC1v1004720C1 n=1 Tax=Oldenlandia corymbosa var. corymbosa TaxID=529605 RepID=A0AAV1DFX7_OLDCO|nr:OLC1v1004720C1 [Oldenlandia corymbosa var. corymbosa]